jgi:hypothetical protein
MFPFSNFVRNKHELSADDERDSLSRENGRESLIVTLIPIALIVIWAAVFFKH